MDKKFVSSFVLVCLSFVGFGFSMTIIGAVLPKIIKTFHWSDLTVGIVFASGSISYFVSTFVCGMISRKLPVRFLMVGGLLLIAVPLFFFGIYPWYQFHVLLYFLIGTGQGAVEFISNYIVGNIERKGRNQLMSLLHAFFALGAFIGPLLTGAVMSTRSDWLPAFKIISIYIFIVMIYAITVPLKRLPVSKEPDRSSVTLKNIWGGLLVLCIFIMLIYVGVEIGFSNWIAEYFVRVKHGSAVTAAFAVSFFWGGLLSGRLFLAALLTRIRLKNQLIFMTSIICVSLVAVVYVQDHIVFFISVFFTGLGCALIYPLIMSIISQYYEKENNLPISMVSTAGGVGSFIFPFALSTIAEVTTLINGFIFLTSGSLIMIAASFAIARLKNDRKI